MREDSETYRRLEQIVVPICRARGLALVDARFCYDHGSLLRVMIEKSPSENPRLNAAPEMAVSLGDCQEVTRDLLTVLELESDLKLRGEYRLEVTSPGLDRPLFSLDDFTRFEGNNVRIQTKSPITGRKRFRGRILNVKGEDIQIEQDGAVVTIPYPAIDKANLVPDL